MKSKLIKLHLGCRSKKIHGFVNIDIDPSVEPDLIEDVRSLPSFKQNSVDLIYASHVLEHFKKREFIKILMRWHEILKPGGVLRLAVPDIEACINHYNKFQNLNILKNLIWGAQEDEYAAHYNGWDFESLKLELQTIGFNKIYKWDWKKTEHSYVDDYSQAYLPRLDKVNGMLMSLNIESIK
jgi:SAM-dependent methyltransferase